MLLHRFITATNSTSTIFSSIWPLDKPQPQPQFGPCKPQTPHTIQHCEHKRDECNFNGTTVRCFLQCLYVATSFDTLSPDQAISWGIPKALKSNMVQHNKGFRMILQRLFLRTCRRHPPLVDTKTMHLNYSPQTRNLRNVILLQKYQTS